MSREEKRERYSNLDRKKCFRLHSLTAIHAASAVTAACVCMCQSWDAEREKQERKKERGRKKGEREKEQRVREAGSTRQQRQSAQVQVYTVLCTGAAGGTGSISSSSRQRSRQANRQAAAREADIIAAVITLISNGVGEKESRNVISSGVHQWLLSLLSLLLYLSFSRRMLEATDSLALLADRHGG